MMELNRISRLLCACGALCILTERPREMERRGRGVGEESHRILCICYHNIVQAKFENVGMVEWQLCQNSLLLVVAGSSCYFQLCGESS